MVDRCYSYPECRKKPFKLFYYIYIRLHLKDDIAKALTLHLIELAPFFDPALTLP
jgi:hypothetical protein